MRFDSKNNINSFSWYRPDIDGLRAIAVLCVVLFHAFPEWLPGGFVGVDVFFVISGFLISGIIFKNLNEGVFSFFDFYSRRVRRIFPALLIVLIFVYVFGWYTLLSDEYKQLGKHVAGGATFSSNIILWLESGYWDNAAAKKPLLHLWSLGVEEQFYIVWPLILWLAWRARLNLLLVTLVILGVSFVFNVYLSANNSVVAFYWPLTRFWELLFGAALAYVGLIFQRGDMDAVKAGWLRSSCSIAGAMLLVAAVVWVKEKSFPGFWALIPTIGAVLIIAAGKDAWLNRVFLSSRILVWIGLISYPLYLWHWPLLSYARIIQGEPTTMTRGGLALGAILLAWLTYVLIERPIRLQNSHARSIFWKQSGLTLAIAAAMVLGIYTYQKDGISSRLVAQLNAEMKNSGYDEGWPEFSGRCDFLKPEDDGLFECKIDARNEPRYAVIGDSKAGAVASGLFRTSVEEGGWMYFGNGRGKAEELFPILSDDPVFDCCRKESAKRVLEIVGGKTSVEAVVIAIASRRLFKLGNDYSIEDLPASPHYDRALSGLDNAVSYLINRGKKVVLLIDNPTLPYPENCMDRKTGSDIMDGMILRPRNPDCRMPIEKYLFLSKQYREMLYEVERRHPQMVRVFDPISILCNSGVGVCSLVKNGRLIYGVTDHISDYASTLVGYELNRSLLPDIYEQRALGRVYDWGGKRTSVGKSVNTQPDGSSALWIRGENFSGFSFGSVYVYFNGHRAESKATVHDKLVTTSIPQGVINSPGSYDVVMVDSIRRTSVGTFVVEP